MLELPISEEIYDFDSLTLKDLNTKIKAEYDIVSQQENKTKEVLTWLKKANKLLSMISLEIEERHIIEDFGQFCIKGQEYLDSLDQYNPYRDKHDQSHPYSYQQQQQQHQNVDLRSSDIITHGFKSNDIAYMGQQSPMIKSNASPNRGGGILDDKKYLSNVDVLSTSNVSTGIDNSDSMSKQSIGQVYSESDGYDSSTKRDYDSDNIGNRIFNNAKMARNAANKKKAMIDFVKATLASTKISDQAIVGKPTISGTIGGSMVIGGSYSTTSGSSTMTKKKTTKKKPIVDVIEEEEDEEPQKKKAEKKQNNVRSNMSTASSAGQKVTPKPNTKVIEKPNTSTVSEKRSKDSNEIDNKNKTRMPSNDVRKGGDNVKKQSDQQEKVVKAQVQQTSGKERVETSESKKGQVLSNVKNKDGESVKDKSEISGNDTGLKYGGDTVVKHADAGIKHADIGVKHADVGVKPGDIGLKQGDIGVKHVDSGVKHADIGAKQGETSRKHGDLVSQSDQKREKKGELAEGEKSLKVNLTQNTKGEAESKELDSRVTKNGAFSAKPLENQASLEFPETNERQAKIVNANGFEAKAQKNVEVDNKDLGIAGLDSVKKLDKKAIDKPQHEEKSQIGSGDKQINQLDKQVKQPSQLDKAHLNDEYNESLRISSSSFRKSSEEVAKSNDSTIIKNDISSTNQKDETSRRVMDSQKASRKALEEYSYHHHHDENLQGSSENGGGVNGEIQHEGEVGIDEGVRMKKDLKNEKEEETKEDMGSYREKEVPKEKFSKVLQFEIEKRSFEENRSAISNQNMIDNENISKKNQREIGSTDQKCEVSMPWSEQSPFKTTIQAILPRSNQNDRLKVNNEVVSVSTTKVDISSTMSELPNKALKSGEMSNMLKSNDKTTGIHGKETSKAQENKDDKVNPRLENKITASMNMESKTGQKLEDKDDKKGKTQVLNKPGGVTAHPSTANPQVKSTSSSSGPSSGSKNRPAMSRTANPSSKNLDFIQISEEEIVDYSDFITSFHQIFSSTWMSSKEIDYLGCLREQYGLFQQHINKIDNVENCLLKYKPAIAPLELSPNDLVTLNDPRHLLMYATKANVDINLYILRQNVFNENLRMMNTIGNENSSVSTTGANNTNTEKLFYRVVKSKQEVYDIITRSFMRKKNWAELPHGMNLKTTWNLLWTWSKPEIDMSKLIIWQKVNHFPNNKNLVRKDLLKKNIERTQKLGAKASQCFNILPQTYILPQEVTTFMSVFYQDMEREKLLNIWIVKPVGKSRGRGISLINDLVDLKYSEPMVVQKYLKNPLLLQGYKFDMRIYVLVTCMNPLEVFIYREGFARMSTSVFSLDTSDLKNLFIHLTNSSVQKHNQNINPNNSDAIIGGTKISLRTLRQRLENRGINFKNIWDQICEIVIKSLVACQPEIPSNPNCFELFGFDIIIDSNHKCWLLEVNSSPSLARENILDDLIKQQLIDDTIDLIEPLSFDRKKIVQVLERRIMEEQRYKSNLNTQNNSKYQLNKDLTYILNGKSMRKVGDLPRFLGNYERIAPTDMSDRIIKIVQSYKISTRDNINNI